ncbi:MAG: hypothetical protein JWO16_184 [Sphingomonas bacterium]|nr:hypothetical protein [Sphingomonas bacterium]
MSFFKAISRLLFALVAASAIGAVPAAAAPTVKYTWTTTNAGFGNHVASPTATFEVPLTSVLAGVINYSDITNIQMTYDGLTFDAYTATSIGLDNKAFVNPVTGALIYHDADQGLGVVGYQGGLFSGSFLSITIDNRYSPLGAPLTSVADQFNSLKNNSPWAGFPTAGFWTASFPAVTNPGVPEPATWAMMLMGFGAMGFAIRRRRNTTVRIRYA